MLSSTVFLQLEAWERKLRPRVEHIQLLNELDLSQEDVQQLTRLVRTLVHGLGFAHATQHLCDRFPCTFAAYLVFQGVYGYVSGDYWSAVAYATGLPRETCQRWGRSFLAVVTRLHLPAHFPGHRYVGVILGHAGIPVHSLPELFQLLHQAATDQELAALPTHELIAHWLETGAVYHKPVKRFLLYGGSLAEAFVERCRQMVEWTIWRKRPQLPADKLAARLNLPQRVVKRYVAWRQGKPIFVPHKYRVRPPHLVLDPWKKGVQLKLPGQLLPRSARTIWKIHLGGEIRLLPALSFPSPYGVQTGELTVGLSSPAERCVVQLIIEGRCVGEWVLLSPPVRWLIFDASTGRQMAHPRRLPARPLWILWPPGTSLSAHPGHAVPVRTKLPRLPGEWRHWRAFEVHLVGVKALHIHTPRNTYSLRVSWTYPSPQLKLVGPDRVPGEVDGQDRCLLYAGSPPRLHLSFPATVTWRHFARSLRRWQLELHHESRGTHRTFSLSALLPRHTREAIYRAEGPPLAGIEIPLAPFHLVGSAPRGVYRVRISAPQQVEAIEKAFGIVPHLATHWRPALCPPTPQSARPLELFVEVERIARLQPHPEQGEVTVEPAGQDDCWRRYRVRVPPDASHVRLLLAYPGLLKHPIPVRIPVPRLRWRLASSADNVAPQWRAHLLTLRAAELSAPEPPALLIAVPQTVRVTALGLDIVTPTGRRVWRLQASPDESSSGVWRFDLCPLATILRGGHWPSLDGHLVVHGEDDLFPLTYIVLRVRRDGGERKSM